MNIELFKKLWMERAPGQGPFEWRILFEFLWGFFMIREIERPVILEIGTRRNAQKKFYEKILNGIHIGVDQSDKYAKPDILGDSHNPETLKKVKAKLREINEDGRCDLLFIDGDHSYKGAKQDFEMYGPLARLLIIFHDITSKRLEVWKLWTRLSTLDEKWTSKRTIEIGYGTGIIILSPGEKIYDRFTPRDRTFPDAFF